MIPRWESLKEDMEKKVENINKELGFDLLRLKDGGWSVKICARGLLPFYWTPMLEFKMDFPKVKYMPHYLRDGFAHITNELVGALKERAGPNYADYRVEHMCT